MSNTKNKQTDVDLISDQCIAVRLRMLNRVVTNIYDDAVRPIGITAGQLNILVTVQKLGRPRQSEVAQALFMEKSTLSRNIDRMRKIDLLSIASNDDERVNTLEVTPEGRALISQSMPLWEGAQKKARKLIGAEGEHGLRHASAALWGDIQSE